MQREGRMSNAKLGAKQLISMLGADDELSLYQFSSRVTPVESDSKVGSKRDALTAHVDAFFPSGETALYEAVEAAYRHLQEQGKPGIVTAVVVLTDGEDNKSKLKLQELTDRIKIDYERRPIRVFTIAYGDEARLEVLQKIADATQAKAYKGTPQNIKEVFKDIGTFF